MANKYGFKPLRPLTVGLLALGAYAYFGQRAVVDKVIKEVEVYATPAKQKRDETRYVSIDERRKNHARQRDKQKDKKQNDGREERTKVQVERVVKTDKRSDRLEKAASCPLRKPCLDDVLDEYNVSFVDDTSQYPMQLNRQLYDVAKGFKQEDERERARAIFDWYMGKIKYGMKKREVGYRHSREVWRDREGVCGESSYLYVSLARAADLEAEVAIVEVDFKGEKVDHMCAVVEIDGKNINVDPAYRRFGVHHKKIRILTDKEAADDFRQYRANKSGNCS